MEEAPISATDIAKCLHISPAGVRRHLEALLMAGDAERVTQIGRGVSTVHSESRGHHQETIHVNSVAHNKRRGRPAQLFQLSDQGRAQLQHHYDDLASAALRQLQDIAGDAAVMKFAEQRVADILCPVQTYVQADTTAENTAKAVVQAFIAAGCTSSVRPVPSGLQICHHHCPISHVAAQFPQLCAAEKRKLAQLFNTHVQQLATIANGDCVCTIHVPLGRVS